MMHHTAVPQRYGRPKGLKVKHLVQLVALTVLFTWFLYQLNSFHKARVRSVRAEKENDIDHELLISDDKGGIDGIGVDHDQITAGEAAAQDDEFIDKKSVSKSRKLLPDPTETLELELSIADGDGLEPATEDVVDDSGEGDRDDDHVRRTDETDLETEGGENISETADDGILIYNNSEESKLEGVDVSVVKTTANSIKTNSDRKGVPDREAALGESKSSESSVLSLTTPEDSTKDLITLEDVLKRDLDVADDTQSGGISTEEPSEKGRTKESKVIGGINSRSPHEFTAGTGDSPVPSESGADVKAEQGRGTDSTVALLGDDQEKSVSEDILVRQEAIVEVVAVGKQEQPVPQEAIAEVVSAVSEIYLIE